jgi:hypothetical protein
MSLAKEMADKLKGNEIEPSISEPFENDIDTIFFGIEPNQKFPTALDLRFSNGNCKAIPYTYISEIDFIPSESIDITASGRKFRIMGRNLKRIYDHLVKYRVRFIQANIGADLTEGDEPFVSSIDIENLTA